MTVATGQHSAADHEQLFTFQDTAAQIVQNASDDPFPWDEVLTGPDGTLVEGLAYAPGWELPASGTYTLSARAFLDDQRTPKDFSVRLRTATTGPAMTIGEAARFTPTEPGRWVASRVQIPDVHSRWGFFATNAERPSSGIFQGEGLTFVVIYDPGAAGAVAPVDLAIKTG